MITILKMSVPDWIIFWLSIGANTSLIIGVVKDRFDKSQIFPTWFLYCFLEIVTMIFVTNLDGNFAIIFGSAVGSFIMAAILLYQGRFGWGLMETLLVIFVIACLIVKYFSGDHWAIITGVAAQASIGIHLIYRTFKNPKVKYNMLGYFLFLIVGIISMANAKNLSAEEFWYSCVEVILDIVVLIPLLIKWRKYGYYL